MLRLSFLANRLKSSQTKPFFIRYEFTQSPEVFLYSPLAPLSASNIYICTLADYRALGPEVMSLEHLTFFLAECSDGGVFTIPAGWNVMATSLTLANLTNIVHISAENDHKIWELCSSAALSGTPLQDIFFSFAKLTHCSFYLVSAKYRIICRGETESIKSLAASNSFLNSFVNREVGMPVSLENLLNTTPLSCGTYKYFRSSSDDFLFFVMPMTTADGDLNYLCSIYAKKKSDFDVVNVLASLCKLIQSNPEQYIYSGNPQFRRLLQFLMSGIPYSQTELDQHITRLPCEIHKYNRLLVLRPLPDNTSPAYVPVILRLRTIFPNINATTYKGDIVACLSSENLGVCRIGAGPYHALGVICDEEHFRGCISDITQPISALPLRFSDIEWMFRHWDNLRNFHQNRHNNATSVLSTARYRTERMIFDYIEEHLEQLNSDSFVNLLSPTALTLLETFRDDLDDILPVLTDYLLNNCNVQQTADFMGLHRNTITKKIHLVENALGFSLSKNYHNFDLYFSCRLLDYHLHPEKYGIS